MEEPSQFSVGQTAHILTCSIMEKPLTGLDDCLNMLLSCFRKGMSDFYPTQCVHDATASLPLSVLLGAKIITPIGFVGGAAVTISLLIFLLDRPLFLSLSLSLSFTILFV